MGQIDLMVLGIVWQVGTLHTISIVSSRRLESPKCDKECHSI